MRFLDKLFNNYIELTINSSYEIKTPENANNVFVELPEYNAPTYIDTILNNNHVLIAGCSGSGKSVLINAILYYGYIKDNTEFILIDNKGIELKAFKNNAKTLYYANNNNVMQALELACNIIAKRYKDIENDTFCKCYEGSKIYVIVDELAVLLQGSSKKEIYNKLLYIAQIGRAANIILITATQNANKSLIGSIKNNYDTIIGLRTTSASDSRSIIGVAGCENLPKYGKCRMLHNGYITTEDINKISDKDIYYINQ